MHQQNTRRAQAQAARKRRNDRQTNFIIVAGALCTLLVLALSDAPGARDARYAINTFVRG